MNKPEQVFDIRFRPSREPTVVIPLGARSVGHSRRGPEYIDNPGSLGILQLFWGIDGEGEMVRDGQSFVLRPGQVFFYRPNQTRWWRTLTDMWEVRWITVDGRNVDAIFGMFGFSMGPSDAGPCPSGLFMELQQCIGDITSFGEHRASSLAYNILCHAAVRNRQVRNQSPAIESWIEDMKSNYASPSYNVDRLALETGINRSVISRKFKTVTGVSPSEYITSLRVQKAMTLLRSSPATIDTIATACGFSEEGYFCRVFKKVTGRTPGAFRKE